MLGEGKARDASSVGIDDASSMQHRGHGSAEVSNAGTKLWSRRLTQWVRLLDPGAPRALMLAALLVAARLFTLQYRTIFLPLIGAHNWRQADTFSVAYNFCHDRFPNFFLPRIDLSQGRSGIMGMEAPVYPYVASFAMRIFGDRPATARFVTWGFFVVAVIAASQMIRLTKRPTVAVGFLIMLALSPMALFEFRQVQPDPVMTALAIIAASFFFFHSRFEKRQTFVLGLFFYTLAILTKPTALFLAPAMGLFAIGARSIGLLPSIRRLLFLLIPIGSWFVWAAWAKHLNDAYNGGFSYFAIGYSFADILKTLREDVVRQHIFAYLLGNYVVNWITYPLVIGGMLLGIRKEERALSLPFYAWFFGAGLCCVLFADRLNVHFFYALILLPAAVFFGALAIGTALDACRDGQSRGVAVRACAVFVLLILAVTPRLALGEEARAQAVSGFINYQTWAGAKGLQIILLLLGISVALATIELRWVPFSRVLFAIALAIAAYFALPTGTFATAYTLATASERAPAAQFEREVSEMRRAVDAHSTRNDVFVVDGGVNPWFLHLPLRRGFAEPSSTINAAGLDYYVAHGARFLLHLRRYASLPDDLHTATPLASGDTFDLYRLDAPQVPQAPYVQEAPSAPQ
ncbi:MAG: hypothetical protein NVS3B20_15440 [Polyangiales bacterium]